MYLRIPILHHSGCASLKGAARRQSDDKGHGAEPRQVVVAVGLLHLGPHLWSAPQSPRHVRARHK